MAGISTEVLMKFDALARAKLKGDPWYQEETYVSY